MRELFVLCMAVVLLPGCSKPYRTPEFLPDDEPFVGLETASPNPADQAATLIMIHGMCHHDREWVVESVERVSDRYGYVTSGVRPTPVLDGGPKGVSAYRADLTKGDRRLTVYGIVFGPVTFPVKQDSLCSDVTADTDLCPFGDKDTPIRATFNATLKHNLMNECLADAVVYLGPNGKQIRLGVREALQAIRSDRARDPVIASSPLLLLSESLGSKVLRDALLCKPDDRMDSVRRMFGETVQVFLVANQIPLLNLGGLGEDCEETVMIRSLRDVMPRGLKAKGGFSDVMRLIDAEKAKARGLSIRELPTPTKIVAFTDPNDLLSYEIDPSDYEGRPVVNVRVSNAYMYFRLFEWPLSAHQDYQDNPKVLGLIQCGRLVPGVDACLAE